MKKYVILMISILLCMSDKTHSAAAEALVGNVKGISIQFGLPSQSRAFHEALKAYFTTKNQYYDVELSDLIINEAINAAKSAYQEIVNDENSADAFVKILEKNRNEWSQGKHKEDYSKLVELHMKQILELQQAASYAF